METNNKYSGGNHMSLFKRATRRLSLLAGSSLAIASAASLSSALTVLAPTAAYAYDECVPVAGTGTQTDGTGGQHDATINGNAPDTFSCTTVRPSVVYNSLGTTGLLTIEFVSSNPALGFSAAAGVNNGSLQTLPGGDAVVNLGPNTVLRGSGATGFGLDATIAAGTTTTVNLADNTVGLNLDRNAYIRGTRAVGAGALVINNSGVLQGIVDLSGLTGAHTLNITSTGKWFTGRLDANAGGGGNTATTTVLAQGNDTVAVSAGGIVYAGLTNAHLIDFREAAGDLDVLRNAGHFAINPGSQNLSINPKDSARPGTVTMSGLEEFYHSGVIMLGSVQRTTSNEELTPEVLAGDGWYDDVLSMPGATFIGEDGQIFFDINFNAGAQTDCTTRNADGDLAAADCLMIVGGSTEGRTFIVINDVQSGDRGAHNPEGILLVDVSGGTSAQGHFVIDPASEGYGDVNGGIIDKGVFFYGLAYNDETQQHLLVGLPGGNAMQQSIAVGTAQTLWRLSTGSWLERQADLRVDPADGFGGGVWLRVLGETAERDMIQTVEGGDQTFTFDNTHEQKSYAVTGGLDVISVSDGPSAYVLGVMAGYAHSEVAYEASPNKQRFNGWTGGFYGSLISGGLFVDAAINANKLTLRQDIPTLGIDPAGTLVSTDLISVGGQIEAGYRFPIMDGAFVEPLANLSYIRTTFDDIEFVPDDPTRVGATAEFEDPTSLRAGIGARVGLDQDYGGVTAQYSLLGRLWNEFEGENSVVFHNLGDDATVLDDFSGQFTEVNLGVSLFSAGGSVSGFANVGGKFGDDYQARTASVGVRVNW